MRRHVYAARVLPTEQTLRYVCYHEGFPLLYIEISRCCPSRTIFGRTPGELA